MGKVKTSYDYKSTIDKDYWEDYLERELTPTECLILKAAKNENKMNMAIQQIYQNAESKGLYIPILTNLHGNCIFESLKYHGLCDDIDNFRNGIAVLMLMFKKMKNFIPGQELSLEELFDLTNYIETVFCKTTRRYYKYNYYAMCVDLSTDTSWTRFNTQLIFTVLSVVLNIRIKIFHNNGHITIIETLENDDTIDICLAQIEEIHYFPLEKRTGYPCEDECPKYMDHLLYFHKWARNCAIEMRRTVETEIYSDSDS